MIDQALTAKRLYAIGVGYSDSTDPVAAGLSISLFQDSVEHLVWGICKHLDVSAKDSESFVSLLEKVELATGNTVTGKARILELNKARVAFKHYGILPNPTEATKFRAYTYDFLVLACERYLGLEFDNLTELSLISDPQVRKHIENGKVARESGNSPRQCLSYLSRGTSRFRCCRSISQRWTLESMT